MNQLTATLNVLTIDSVNGSLTPIASSFLQLPPSAVPVGVVVDPLGNLIIADGSGNAFVYLFNPASASLNGPTIIPLSTTPAGGNIFAVAEEPSTHAVYFPYAYPASNAAPGGVLGFTLSDPNSVPTLTVIPGSPFLADGSPSSVTVAGLFAYVTNFATNDVSVFTIDPKSGVLTLDGTNESLGTGPVGPSQMTIIGTYQ